MNIIKRKTIGVGVLSWRGYSSLEASLQSYVKHKFLDIFDEALLFLPEAQPQGHALGAKYGIKTREHSENLGIYGGFRALAENLSTDFVLLLENDWLLTEKNALSQISFGQKILTDERAICVRYRNISKPGDPMTGLSKYYRYYPSPDNTFQERALAAVRRCVRFKKARKLMKTAPYAECFPEKVFPNAFKRIENNFLITDSSIEQWTNNPTLIDRNFYLNTLLSKVEQIERSSSKINNFKNIEGELRIKWWRQKKWPIAISPGLFTHNRLNDRGY